MLNHIELFRRKPGIAEKPELEQSLVQCLRELAPKVPSAACDYPWWKAVKAKLLDLGLEIVGNAQEQFTAFQAKEFARWKKAIEVGKIAAD